MIQSEFGKEVDRRESHLAALPGKVYHEWFTSLARATDVFNRNTQDLDNHFKQFVGEQVFVTELEDEFDAEAARLLLNYLAALTTLRDAQRVVHHKLWPEREEEDRTCPTCGQPQPKRTKWEVEVWDPKREELLGDERIAFLAKLRDYSLHYAIPVVTTATNFESIGGAGGKMEWKNTVAVDRAELLKWDRWGARARGFITGHDGDNIELLPLVVLYSTGVREFHKWFLEQVEDPIRLKLSEYRDKHDEYWAWRNVEGTWGQFGGAGKSVQYREVAKARLQRAACKTSGWRVIAQDENGEWSVGPREAAWPPLPSGPR